MWGLVSTSGHQGLPVTVPSPPPTSLQIICLDLSEEMSLPKLESFNG